MPSRRSVLIGLAALAGAAASARFAMPDPYYSGPVSDHFDGRVFFNPGKPREQGFVDLLRWQLGGGRVAWPDAAPADVVRPSPRVDDLAVTMIGHASLLLQIAGLNVLLDPVWSERASPLSFAGPRRVNPPGVRFEDLPKIDVVLVSHDHYDHLDLDTLGRLWRDHRPRIIAPLGNDAIIRSADPGIAVETMDWRTSLPLSAAVEVHALEMHHWSARGLFDRNFALWAAFLIRAPGGAVYHVGDSGYGGGDYFRLVRERFGGCRLAILPIGAYEPRWFMSYSHMNPEEAVKAATDCGAAYALAHHWGTFQLTNEGIEAPVLDLRTAMVAAGLAEDRFRTLRPGGRFDVPAA